MVLRSRKKREYLALADRTDQKSALSRFLLERTPHSARCLLIEAREASGISYFLRYAAEHFDGRADCIYADLERDSLKDVVERFVGRRSRTIRGMLLSRFDLGAIWSAVFKTLAAIPSKFPLLRPVLVGVGEAGGFFFSPYGSEHIDKFARAALPRTGRAAAILFLDNAQKDPACVEELLRGTYAPEYDSLIFVLAHVDREGAPPFWRYLEEMQSKTCQNIDQMKFPGPNETLLSALSPELEPDQRRHLLDASAHNIHTLKRILSGVPESGEELPALENYLLSVLVAAEQPVRLSDLSALVTLSPLVVTPPMANLTDIVGRLTSRSVVQTSAAEDGDVLLAPLGRANPVIKALAADSAGLMAVKSELYEYFSAAAEGSVRHSASSLACLLYRLAKDVAPEHVPERAQTLLDVSLKMGSLNEAQRYISEAMGSGDDLHARFIQAAYYVARLDFQPALDLLDRLGRSIWSRHRVLAVLHAIALNRVRKHGISNVEIDALLADDRSAEEVALLVSYKVAAFLHDGDYQRAREVREQAEARAAQSRCYGYFLRSTAACYMWGEGKDVARAQSQLQKAKVRFLEDGDQFGALTAQANMGAVAAEAGDLELALELTQKAYRGLAVFGLHNVEEVGVNLGTALLLTGRIDAAAQHLRSLLPALADDFPKAVGECSLVIAELCLGNLEQARQQIARLNDWVEVVGLDEAVTLAREATTLVRRATRDNLDAPAILRSCHVDWCQYWSQNPLAMLPASDLAL